MGNMKPWRWSVKELCVLFIKCLAGMLLLTHSLLAADYLHVTQYAMVAGQVGDCITSYNRSELNPLLGSKTFKTRGIAIKTITVTSFLVLQNNKRGAKHKKLFTALNVSLTGVSIFAVTWNLRRR